MLDREINILVDNAKYMIHVYLRRNFQLQFDSTLNQLNLIWEDLENTSNLCIYILIISSRYTNIVNRFDKDQCVKFKNAVVIKKNFFKKPDKS